MGVDMAVMAGIHSILGASTQPTCECLISTIRPVCQSVAGCRRGYGQKARAAPVLRTALVVPDSKYTRVPVTLNNRFPWLCHDFLTQIVTIDGQQ